MLRNLLRKTTAFSPLSSSSSSLIIRRNASSGVSPVKEEALWALEEAKARGMIGPEDTSLLFHSWTTHRRYLRHLRKAFSSHPNPVHHAIAVKTNPHPAVLKQLVHWGFGLECASIEEVLLAVNAGCPGRKIVFDSPVKTRREIDLCHENPLLRGILVNANSLEELDRIPHNPNFVVGVRINPVVDTGTPEIFQVSGNESKFGIPISQKSDILDAIRDHPAVTQLHVHSGTAMEDLSVAVKAISSVVDVAVEANEMFRESGAAQSGRRITGVDIGGGVGAQILPPTTTPNGGGEEAAQQHRMSTMEWYVSELRKAAPALWSPEMNIVTEFGQWSYFYSGYAYSKIEYAFERGGDEEKDNARNVAYIHLGADMFLRDVYTGTTRAGMEFLPIGDAAKREKVPTDIAGPLCFAGDYLKQQEDMPRLKEGDEMLMLHTGSNAFGLWSRHCSRTVPQVIGVDRSGADEDSLEVMSPRRNPHLEESYDGSLLSWNEEEKEQQPLSAELDDREAVEADDDDDLQQEERVVG